MRFLSSFFSLLFLLSANLCANEISLVAPTLDNHSIKARDTAIRPTRNACMCIKAERIGEQLIIHNYGHGGYGWSLLPGAVNESIRYLKKSLEEKSVANPTITVVGAGCYGLFSAIKLHEEGFSVKIVAKDFEHLSSHYSAGILAPIFLKISKEKKDWFNRLEKESFLYYKALTQAKEPEFKGVSLFPLYVVNDPGGAGLWPLVKIGLIDVPQDVKINFGGDKDYMAQKFETIFMDSDSLMKQFHEKINQMGIPIEHKEIHHFSEVDSNIVFNCTGYGAKQFGDKSLIPVVGHLISFSNQPKASLNYMLYAKIPTQHGCDELYWVPRHGGTIGGTFLTEEEDPETLVEEFAQMLERAQDFFK